MVSQRHVIFRVNWICKFSTPEVFLYYDKDFCFLTKKLLGTSLKHSYTFLNGCSFCNKNAFCVPVCWLAHELRRILSPCRWILGLKEPRNRILCIICAWSIFCSIRIYVTRHFLNGCSFCNKNAFCVPVCWLAHELRRILSPCRWILGLKEPRNRILCIICAWSIFCSIRIYVTRHFLPILLSN